MTTTIIVLVCAALFLAWMIWRQYHSLKLSTLALNLLGLALYFLLLRVLFGFPDFSPPQSKGPEDNRFLALALAMYACMLAGMVAEFFYHHFGLPPSDRKLEIGTFVRPLLISPMIFGMMFVPLAASLQSINPDFSSFDRPRLMLFLMAFENGFLWRGYASNKLTKSGKTSVRSRGTA